MNLTSPCCCCLLRESEKHLTTPYSHFGRTEIYSAMIQECFDIRVTLDEAKYGICEVCVGRLRDANDFKILVQHSQRELQAQMEYKHEIPTFSILEEDTVSVPAEPWSEYIEIKEERVPVTNSRNRGPKGVVPHPCQICNKTFNSESNLAKHMKVAHNEEYSAGSSRATFENQFAMFCLDNTSTTTAKKSGTKSERSNYCNFCAMVFPTNVLLAAHRRTHKAKKVHACHICNKIFKKKYILTNHILVHKGEKPFSCERCEKRFTTRTGLLGHQRIHTSTDVFVCDICNKKLTTKKSLTFHIMIHSGIKPYECDECHMKFAIPASLSQHKAIHSGQKPFQCSVCDKQFRRKYHLRDHMHTHTHTQQRPFVCELCGKKFLTKSILKRHSSKVHG